LLPAPHNHAFQRAHVAAEKVNLLRNARPDHALQGRDTSNYS
jgi:hypothetical protein